MNLFRKNGSTKGKNTFTCSYCNLEFSDKEHLERHKRVAHKKGR